MLIFVSKSVKNPKKGGSVYAFGMIKDLRSQRVYLFYFIYII